MTEPRRVEQPAFTDPEKIRVVESHYRACWNCIQTGAHHHCQHYKERIADQQLMDSRIDPASYMSTLLANAEAFPHRDDVTVSPIETRLLEAFWRAGLDPLQQYRIAGYIVDFAFPYARLVVEADGKEYHQDEERERRRDEALRKAGWHVVHFTGRQIHQDADACVASVYRLARTSLV